MILNTMQGHIKKQDLVGHARAAHSIELRKMTMKVKSGQLSKHPIGKEKNKSKKKGSTINRTWRWHIIEHLTQKNDYKGQVSRSSVIKHGFITNEHVYNYARA